MSTDVDPHTFAGFENIDDQVCPEMVVYVVNDVEHKARCEQDAGHEPPCTAELQWVPNHGQVDHAVQDTTPQVRPHP